MNATCTCYIKGCERPPHAHGLCGSHYQRALRHGDPLYSPASRIHASTCSVEGCEGPYESRGWCHTHYTRWWTTGDPGDADLIKQRDRTCSIEGCGRKHRAQGYCEKHLARVYRKGDPLDVQYERFGDNVGYQAAHDRVKAIWGSPRLQRCDICSEPARDWAYDHQDSDEKRKPDGSCPYSLKIEHYRPLCSLCHRRLDNRYRMMAELLDAQ